MKEVGLVEYYNRFNEDDLTLAYFGSFKDSITEKIIDLSESYLDKNKLRGLKRKTVFLVAECFQNVARHGQEKAISADDLKIENAFFMRVRNDHLHIASANPIPNDKKEFLTERIEYLNKLSKDDLYKLYKNVLSEGTFSDKGGASLGLIEMARKTGHKLNFHFEPQDNNKSIFYLMLSLGPPDVVISSKDKKLIFDEIIQLNNELFKANEYILFKSNFTQETLLPVIQMIENNLQESDNSFSIKRNLVHSSVEMMQNISRYGIITNGKKTGMFSFGRKTSGYSVKSVYKIDSECKDFLTGLLSKLKTKTSEELKLMYKDSLKSKLDLKSELSFIDLTRISKTWDHDFSPSDSDSYLFAFSILL